MNTKKTGNKVSTLASQTLRDKSSSKIQKQLAGSTLSQSNTIKQTGSKMGTVASKALKSDKYSSKTKSLAGSALSQSNKKR